MTTELTKLRERERELSEQLVKIVNKREALERELLPIITQSIAAHERLSECRRAIATLALKGNDL